MKITIEEDKKMNDTEVLIRCKTRNSEIEGLVERIKRFNEKLPCYEDKITYYIKYEDIFYIESVDNTVYVYIETKVLETKLKLYELEEKLKGSNFLRCNKATILNLVKIRLLEPQMNRSIIARMDNDERIYISRKYVKSLKKLLGV